MKKNFSYSLITTTICAIGLACAPTANAATGEKALGFAGGFASYNDGGYGKIYFQYEIAPHVRLAPEMGYIFRNEDCSGFEFSFDVQFPFRLARGFSIYPLAGLTLNNWSYEDDGHATRGGIDFGAGFDIYLTSSLKLSLQGKYSAMNDTSGAFFDMGIAYVF